MFSILVLLFTLIPAIEIYLLFSIGAQIGGGNTFLIVILTGIAGAYLAKSQGLAILGKIQGELSSGALPAKEIIHGLLVFGGGLLLMTPGFLTDVLGFSMVLPGSRHFLVLILAKHFQSAITSGNVHVYTQGFSFQSQAGRPKEGPTRVDHDTFEAEYTKN